LILPEITEANKHGDVHLLGLLSAVDDERPRFLQHSPQLSVNRMPLYRLSDKLQLMQRRSASLPVRWMLSTINFWRPNLVDNTCYSRCAEAKKPQNWLSSEIWTRFKTEVVLVLDTRIPLQTSAGSAEGSSYPINQPAPFNDGRQTLGHDMVAW